MKPNLRLKRERERHGWSQARVAEVLGINPRSVSRWERGVSFPYPYFREKLCALFEKNAEALGLLPENEGDTTNIPPETPSELTPQFTTSPQYLFDPMIPLFPSQIGELVGQNELFLHLKERLLQNNPGVLTILPGLPGVGKTALVIALARDPDIQNSFSDGILWASVGPSPQLFHHIGRWSTLLGCTQLPTEQNGDYREWARHLHVTIAQRRILVIIDNVWDVETILALKVGGISCAYLITTRIPQIAQYFSPEEVRNVPALNEQESLALLARFVPTLTSMDARSTTALLSAVGGIPLALTLIGRYLRAQALTGQPRRLRAALQHVLDVRNRLLLSEPRECIDTYSSLAADTPLSLYQTIAVSEQHIEKLARRALRALSIFPPRPNSFSEEAALVVCRLPVDVLDDLCDAGLLESAEPGRYQLHQVIADYAHLSWTGENEVTRLFIEYMVGYIETHANEYVLIERESANILAALEQAYHHDFFLLYGRGIVALTPFLLVRQQHALAIDNLRNVYRKACEIGLPLYIMQALSQLGHIARTQGQFTSAEASFQEGLVLARQLGNKEMSCHFLLMLAETLGQRGEYTQSQVYQQEGQSIARHLHLREWERLRYQTDTPTYKYRYVHFTEPQAMLRRGYLADISELFSTWHYAQYLSPASLKVVSGPDGHVYGIPTDIYALGLVYNRRLFQEAGLHPDQPPTTWHEFRDMARQLTNPSRGIYGFAEVTANNMGGWHFTNWLYTAGVQAQEYQGGSWRATFNDPKSVQLLEMLKEMRFSDGSIPDLALLSDQETSYLLCKGVVAMIIATPSLIDRLYQNGYPHFSDLAIAPMPQNGGNACLMGGTAYVFHAQAPRQSLEEAFKQVVAEQLYLDTNLEAYEDRLKAAVSSGKAIGIPRIPLFTQPLQQQLDEITAKYINLPRENYRAYAESRLQYILEPPIEAQQYYTMLDPIMQSILTNPDTHPQQLLDSAAEQFQARFLEQASHL